MIPMTEGDIAQISLGGTWNPMKIACANGGVRSACPTRKHPGYPCLVELGFLPMAKAGGKSSRTAKACLAINARCGADELTRRRNRTQGLVSGVQTPS